MKRYIIGIDEGTTSERVVLYDTKLNTIVDFDSKKITQHYPHNGWVEHDAEEIWHNVNSSLEKIIKRNRLKATDIYSIGITNQRETTVAWDKVTGQAICPAIVWQCRRTSDMCAKISDTDKLLLKEKTGLILDAYFSATKMNWILNNVADAKNLARKNQLALGTIDSYLVYKLTKHKVFATDTSNVSRTMLIDLDTPMKYDDFLLKFFDIPISALPTIKNTADDYGSACTSIGEIPIACVIGDQQSSLFGQGCYSKGSAKCTYGTGAFLLINNGKTIPCCDTVVSTIAWTINNKTTYAIEGSVFNVGSTLNFLKNNLHFFGTYKEIEQNPPQSASSDGLYFVPAFTGLGSPHWNSQARGEIVGMTLSTTKTQIVTSALESFAFSILDIVDEIKKTGTAIKELHVDGGVSKNNYLLQFQSNLLKIPVLRTQNDESTSYGALFLAGLKVGAFKDMDDIKEKIQVAETIKPQSINLENDINGWRKIVSKI